MEKIWEIKDPESYLNPRPKSQPTAPPAERDPARAYTLSLLLWGAGQSYNEEYGKALALQLLLIALLVFSAAAVVFRDALMMFLQSGRLLSKAFLSVEILLLVLLALWVCLAGDAYRGAARSRSTRFPGVRSRIAPGLCSLLFPGWGQFLNGQPLKGSFYSAFAALALFSLVSAPAVLLVWPQLEPNDSRAVIEDIFFVTAFAAPLAPFLWLFSAYDALLVSLDDYRKEPVWERIKAANNRRRNQGLVRGVVPWIGRTFLLALVLVFCAIVVAGNFPARFYAEKLALLRGELCRMDMILLPEFLARVAAILPPG